MFNRIISKVKKDASAIKKAAANTIGSLILGYATLPTPVLAAGGGYTAPLDNLKTILITIAGSAGVILVVYGGIRFAIAFQKMDQNGEHSAIYTIIAGGVLIGLSAVLGVLGV